MKTDREKIYLSWDDFASLTETLSRQISRARDDNTFFNSLVKSKVHLVGVARGGLIPAVLMSQMMRVPMTPIHYSTRDHVTRSEFPPELETILIRDHDTSVVIVDDICDSGLTFKELRDKCTFINSAANIHFASVIEKTCSTFEPDFSGLCINDDRWVVFPWEIK